MPDGEAILMCRIISSAGRGNPLQALVDHAHSCLELEKYENATTAWSLILRIRLAQLDPDPFEIRIIANNLGRALDGAGRFLDAIILLRETLRLQIEAEGREHPGTL